MSDDAITPIVCLACGGNYRSKGSTDRVLEVWCRWCVRGVMTESQRKRWKEWSAVQKGKGRHGR